MFIRTGLVITTFVLAACSPAEQPDTQDQQNEETTVPEVAETVQESGVCDDKGNRYASDEEARATRLPDAAFGATYCPEYTAGLHPSWDKDQDGINDCENDGSCDHTVDYSQPRPE
ncbi:hypothetical protein [Sphingorhabdus sp. Alg239-R122]|uniref:hypothetical protein n=1 Tax=Sphingorhabdus sp. Alg239-R122 TaxID=2305989 RepID=UPI0013DB235E|nr:hypothetical protein [Sphingorhabdus sp. Alg239-R122]